MKTEKPQVAGYGLHYHANVQLIPNVSVRTVLQCLVDLVRKQLTESLNNQTVIISLGQLGRMTGIDPYRTIPGCVDKLEGLGLIKKHKNGITLLCDDYVAAVQLCETLPKAEKDTFLKQFHSIGVEALQNCRGTAKLQGREALIGISGSSIPLENPAPLQKCRDLDNESEKPYKNVGVQTSEVENPTFLQGWENPDESNQTPTILQGLAQQIAETLHFCRGYCNFEELCEFLTPTFLQGSLKNLVKYAFETGNFPNTFTFELQNPYNFAGGTPTFLQGLASKSLQFCRTVIIRDNIKDKGATSKVKVNKNEEEDLKKGFENFGKVEVVDFNESSVKVKEDLEEVDEISQQVLKRAERSMRDRNPYRNKPFIKSERAYEIVECLDEVVKSPVDFFINQFWEGIYILYLDNYKPSDKIDEEGEPVEDSQISDWTEMIGAPLPQDEVYNLAKNVYEDLLGAVEQGKFVYGPNSEWEVRFSFNSFEDFIPYQIFQWTPCTMQDKSVPALKVAIDRFYDIEAKDVFTSSKTDKRTKNAQNKKLVQGILSAEYIQLTPIEAAIKKFYEDFVVTGEDNVIDEFTDGRGTPLESGGGLPDHLLKPWCYKLSSVGYNELTGVLNGKYRPIDGIHKKAYIFSAESVVEWNERNGYRDSISHSAIHP